ncbi:MAG: hypothetical protein ABR973_11715 [Candidatus Acidiferrales bacterium]
MNQKPGSVPRMNYSGTFSLRERGENFNRAALAHPSIRAGVNEVKKKKSWRASAAKYFRSD